MQYLPSTIPTGLRTGDVGTIIEKLPGVTVVWAMSFRLGTILWLFALTAASMAAFGPWGILLAFGVAAFWARVLTRPAISLIEVLVTAIIALVLAGLLLPAG
jgi:hypothetical protein